MPKKPPKILEPEIDRPEIIPDDKIFNKQDMQVFPPGRHVWRQQGPYVICRECILHHAVYIGTDKLMVGEDNEGKPIIKTKRELGW